MFNKLKQLFSAEKKEVVVNEVSYKTNSKYDGSIYRGTFLIDGNVFVGAYIRDGHPQYYTFVTEAGLSCIPRTSSFKQLDRKQMLSLDTEAIIARVKDGKKVKLAAI